MTDTALTIATPMSLADRRVWSPAAFVAVIAVSTVIFGFGNADAVSRNPLTTLVSNAALTAAIFGLVAGVTSLVGPRISRFVSLAMVVVAIVVLAAGRGVALWFVMRASGVDNLPDVWVTALVSVVVFGFGFVLTVLTVAGVTKWRSLQTRIQQLDEQRKGLHAVVHESIVSHTDHITRQLRHHLQPQLDTLRLADSSRSPETLTQMVTAVVRPLSHTLHREFPAVNLPTVTTALVSAKEFLHLAIKGKPFAPVMTGALFSLGLAPRNLADGVSFEAVMWTVGIGVVVGVGVWAINSVSQRFLARLGLTIHATTLVGLLALLGLTVAHLPALIDPGAGSPAAYYLVGPVATVLTAGLVGGVVNVRQYFRVQEATLSALDNQLARELAQARTVFWRRNQTLATVLHGSLQSTLNAGAIRLARAKTDDVAADIADELANAIDEILHSLHSPHAATGNLSDTISNITATWEDITDITWQVDDSLVTLVTGTSVEQAMADCLIEAIYNAIKHQSPETLSVTLIQTTPDEIMVSVTHPGQIQGPVSGGLGSRIFDYLTVSHSLTEKDGVVEFRGTFAAPIDIPSTTSAPSAAS